MPNNESNFKEKIDKVFKEYFDLDTEVEKLLTNESENSTKLKTTSNFKDLLNGKLKGVNKKKFKELNKVSDDILSGLQHRDLDKIEEKYLLKGRHLRVMDVVEKKKGLSNNSDFKKRRIKSNDVLLRVKGQIGPAALISEDETDLHYYNDLVRIRVDLDIIIPQYLSLYLNSFIGRHFLNKFSKSKSMNYINIGSVKKVPVLTPMLIDQWKIVREYFNMINIQQIEEV